MSQNPYESPDPNDPSVRHRNQKRFCRGRVRDAIYLALFTFFFPILLWAIYCFFCIYLKRSATPFEKWDSISHYSPWVILFSVCFALIVFVFKLSWDREDLDTALARAIGGDRVDALQSAVLPSPPGVTAYPGNHLFINFRYADHAKLEDARRLLARVRKDIVAILRCLVLEQVLHTNQSICVTLVAPVSEAASEDDPPLRVYRYSILCSALPKSTEKIDEEFLVSNHFFLQSSDATAISNLIEREPKNRSQLKKELWDG